MADLGAQKKDELVDFWGVILGTNLSLLGLGFIAHLRMFERKFQSVTDDIFQSWYTSAQDRKTWNQMT
jgi:hypothetical protein